MESAGHAFGPPVQEAYQVEHQKEELFQRIDQQVSKSFQRDKRTPRVRASLAKNCLETPRVSSSQSVQGGSHHPLPEHWGRGMGSRSVQAVLPSDFSTQSDKQSHPERHADFMRSPRSFAGRLDSHSSRHSCSKAEIFGVAGRRQPRRAFQPIRNSSQGAVQPGGPRGVKICPKGISERDQIEPPVKRRRKKLGRQGSISDPPERKGGQIELKGRQSPKVVEVSQTWRRVGTTLL